MKPIIKVENVSKRYQLGDRGAGYQTIRETIVKSVNSSLRRLSLGLSETGARSVPCENGELWALREINFEVAPGEVLGLIGRNGAGKSTLLKILSRITDPTTGTIEMYGRVGSLLEVGTGFHPELTGRENIFLSGAILGMRRTEIVRKLDEIVAFAGIEEFLDTPVKRYSSGMFVRLAFAVAAHLEPEILLIDEVLAVGDWAFQKRCLGKIGDVARDGRTVLFVSHNMASIEALCSTCLLINNGQLESKGKTSHIIARYMAAELKPESARCSLIGHPGRRKDSIPIMTSVTLRDDRDTPVGAIRMGSSLALSVSFTCERRPIIPVIGVVLKNAHGVAILGVNNKFIGGYHFEKRILSGNISCQLEHPPLLPGHYSIDLYLGDGAEDVDVVYDAISLEVQPADVFGTGQLPPSGSGVIYWPAKFALAMANGSN
jgi:lipopolysaccharide transport system ATP-binding protein